MEDIVKKLNKLNEIKPRQEWVSLLKSEIMNNAEERQVVILERKINFAEVIFGIIFQRKFAYASMTLLIFMVVGVFGFVNLTTPGDIFYPVRKMAEQTAQQTPVQIAYNRSEDLVRVVKENRTQNLAPAINEYKASISDAVKNLTDSLAQDSGTESMNEIINEVIKIKENQKNLQVLGVNVGNEDEVSELTNLLSTIVKNQIADFEDSTLTDEQQETLAQVKELNEQGKYSEALELILLMKK